MRPSLLLEPLLGDLDLHPAQADRAPDPLAALAGDVLVVLVQVQLHRIRPTLEAPHRALHLFRISSSNSGKYRGMSAISKLLRMCVPPSRASRNSKAAATRVSGVSSGALRPRSRSDVLSRTLWRLITSPSVTSTSQSQPRRVGTASTLIMAVMVSLTRASGPDIPTVSDAS